MEAFISKAAALLMLIIVPILSAAQSAQSGLHLTTQKPHPLDEVLFRLEEKYNWPLTYEEPPVLAADELTTKTAPSGAPILVRRMIPMSVDLSPEQLSATGQARLAVINSLLAAYAKNGNSDSFRAVQDGRFIHIIPVSARGADGTKQPFEPIMSTKVFFAEQHFSTMYDLLDEVLGQVSQKRGIPIVLATVPTNLFRQAPVFEVADNEPAQDVLERAFWNINGPRLAKGLDAIALTWALLYDPTGRQYWFNVGVVNVDIAGTPKPGKISSQNGSDGAEPATPHATRKAQ